MIELAQLTKRLVIESLRSDVCPACGKWKRLGQSLCARQYHALPTEMKRRLYDRVGSGYERALFDALQHLGAKDFLTGPPMPAAPPTAAKDAKPNPPGLFDPPPTTQPKETPA